MCATPCVTAFSTSGCSSSGGTRHASASSLTDDVVAQPVAEAHPLDREEARDQPQLARQRNPRLGAERQALAQEVGEQHAHAPRRRRHRIAVSALIECRLLKRKCGSICARSIRSSASRASTCTWSARRSAARVSSNTRDQVADGQRQQVEQQAEDGQQRVRAPALRPDRRHRSRGAPASRPSVRAASSHIALEIALAVSAVATIRSAPVAASGMPRDTYHADRQTNA